MNEYLYSNSATTAERRLRGLEAIEDVETIKLLSKVGVASGWHCLEIGAGAGSTAQWLANACGTSGRVVATDIDTRLLGSSAYEVWTHDIRHEELPSENFDLVHMRHVLIHIDSSRHPMVLNRIQKALKPYGMALIEESDFKSWRVDPNVSKALRTFTAGVDATLAIYRSRNMDIALGSQLQPLMYAAGFSPAGTWRRRRCVTGGSEEALFHQISAKQLAESVSDEDPARATILRNFAVCLGDSTLKYETRSTVSVTGIKQLHHVA